MGRLIDADKTIRIMWGLWNSDINNSVKFSAEETQAITRAFKRLQKAIEKQPTAYSVEKVVDVVREDCYSMGFDESQTEIIINDIVKKGGVE